MYYYDKMKRTFDDFDIIPNYIVKIANAIKNNQNIVIMLNKSIGDDIDGVDYLLNYLNLSMENKLIKNYIHYQDINFIYRYNLTTFHIILEYNENKEIYKISCTIL